MAQRLVADLTPAGGLEYSPWMVANLRLRRPISAWWDNVFRDSRSLGYVVATHQHLTHDGGPTVITYYRPLDDGPPAEARRLALGRRYDEWCEDIVSDLECAHPGIAGEIECLDARIWGHGMIRPVPGFIWGESRARMASRHGKIVFAHSDMSGISIFEEACARGAWAAKEVEAQS